MPSGIWVVRLAAAAERDFQSILAWTAAEFGETQARRYRDVLIAAITALMDGPSAHDSRPRDDVAPGARVLHVARGGRRARHILLYRVRGGDAIEVLRILHDAMDIPRHVSGDDRR